jgi:hypothetical protein
MYHKDRISLSFGVGVVAGVFFFVVAAARPAVAPAPVGEFFSWFFLSPAHHPL